MVVTRVGVVNMGMMFSQDQIDHLSSLRFFNVIDDRLRIVSAVRIVVDDNNVVLRVLLILEMYYDGDRVSGLSFNLHNYNYDEIVNEAKNIRSNNYIMREVDNFLAGDIE